MRNDVRTKYYNETSTDGLSKSWNNMQQQVRQYGKLATNEFQAIYLHSQEVLHLSEAFEYLSSSPPTLPPQKVGGWTDGAG